MTLQINYVDLYLYLQIKSIYLFANTKNQDQIMPKNYYEKIVIGRGGVVAKCGECKTLTGLRFVTETRNLAPNSPNSWQDTCTYKLCDGCADHEKVIYAQNGATVIDGREEAK